MADLAVAVTVDWLVSSVVHWSHGGRDGRVDDGVSHGVVTEVTDVPDELGGGSGGGQDSGETEESLEEGGG